VRELHPARMRVVPVEQPSRPAAAGLSSVVLIFKHRKGVSTNNNWERCRSSEHQFSFSRGGWELAESYKIKV